MNNKTIPALYTYLCKLNAKQFKVLYGIIVHCLAHDKSFISTHNLFNLWCELNYLCHKFDESFPDPYDDHLLLKSFCQAHPYYFIDILPLELVSKLFAEYCDEHLDVLENLVQIICEQDSLTTHQYVIDALGLEHKADELEHDLDNHIKHYS